MIGFDEAAPFAVLAEEEAAVGSAGIAVLAFEGFVEAVEMYSGAAGEDSVPRSTGEEVEERVERCRCVGTDEHEAADAEGDECVLTPPTSHFGIGAGIGVGGSVEGHGNQRDFGIAGDVQIAMQRAAVCGEIFFEEQGVVGAEGPRAIGAGVKGMDHFAFFGIVKERTRMGGLVARAEDGADGMVVEGVVRFEETGPAVVEDFVGEGFAGGGGCGIEAVEILDPEFDVAVEASAGVGDAAEVNDGVEKGSQGDELCGEGVGGLAGDDVDAEGRGFGFGEERDGEEAGRERGGVRSGWGRLGAFIPREGIGRKFTWSAGIGQKMGLRNKWFSRAFELTRGSAPDHDGGAAQDDGAAMGAGIAHASGRHSADHDGAGAFRDGVGRSDAGAHSGSDRGGQTSDQDRGDTRGQNRAAYMGDQDRDHWTDMHIGNARLEAWTILFDQRLSGRYCRQ